MKSHYKNDPTRERQPFPSSPDITALAGMLFQSLGGVLTVDQNGQRNRVQVEPAQYRLSGASLPKLPHAQPNEVFLNGDEYRGAMKVLDYVLDRLSDADREMLYGAFASHPGQAEADFDFRELLG